MEHGGNGVIQHEVGLTIGYQMVSWSCGKSFTNNKKHLCEKF